MTTDSRFFTRVNVRQQQHTMHSKSIRPKTDDQDRSAVWDKKNHPVKCDKSHQAMSFHSRVAGACPVTTDMAMRVDVRTKSFTTKVRHEEGTSRGRVGDLFSFIPSRSFERPSTRALRVTRIHVLLKLTAGAFVFRFFYHICTTKIKITKITKKYPEIF